MKFVVDKNIQPQLPRAIQALRRYDQVYEIVALRDQFPGRAEDPVWMLKLGQEGGWIAISGDVNIKRRPHELAAWEQSGLPFLFLDGPWSKLTYWAKAALLIRWWPVILDRASKLHSGEGVIVPCSAPDASTMRAVTRF